MHSWQIPKGRHRTSRLPSAYVVTNLCTRCSVYFWNEVTGDTQLEDPGDVPLHDEEGNCFWLDDQGNKLDRDPNVRVSSHSRQQ